jgi:hypothetical protein
MKDERIFHTARYLIIGIYWAMDPVESILIEKIDYSCVFRFTYSHEVHF